MVGRPRIEDIGGGANGQDVLFGLRRFRYGWDMGREETSPDLTFARKARTMLDDIRTITSFTLKYLVLPVVVIVLGAAWVVAR